MSRLDERRRPRRGQGTKRKYPGAGKRLSTKEVQMALKLMGGTTAKDKGEPFDDPIPF